ncbi:MAG: hypothetical protein SW833_11210 [Cyanobacteriota bacterium]|nr:hypothetical protein [Cyanobacteriota bacterium]
MSYSNSQLTQALQPYADSFSVALQPIIDDRVLDLYLNRPPELAAHCPKLVAVLKRQIARQFPEIRTLYLYSRVWGEETIDWEAQIEMPQLHPPNPPPPSPTPPQKPPKRSRESSPVRERTPRQHPTNNRSTPGDVRGSRQPPGGQQNRTQNQNTTSDPSDSHSRSASPNPRNAQQDEATRIRDRAPLPKPSPELEKALPEPEEFNLQTFRFSRNRRLVEGSLKNPEPDMAELIQFFHNLDEADKRQLLPLLENWFKNPEQVDIHSLPEATQTWLGKTNSNPQQLRSTGVWLSRYCFDAEKTMEQVNATFAGIVAAETAYEEQKEREQEPEVFAPERDISTSRRSRSGRDTQNSSPKDKDNDQRFTRDELIPLGGPLVVVLVLGWLLSSLVGIMGNIGLLVAICAIGSGLAYTTGNTVLGGIFSFVLFVISTFWWIFGGIFFFIIGGVDFLGWLIGVIIGVSVTTTAKQSNAPSLLSPKPLRMAAVLGLGLLLTLGPALFSGVGGGGIGNVTVGDGKVLKTHAASGTITREGKTFEAKGAAAIWDAAGKELRISLLPVSVTDGDIEFIQEYLQAETDERSTNDSPARELAYYRPSHDSEQFAQMPSAQLDIKFADNATTFTTQTALVYNLGVIWPESESTTSFRGVMCYFTRCQNPKSGLSIFKFEPAEGGMLSLSVKPQRMASPFVEDNETQIDLKVDTKVALKEG